MKKTRFLVLALSLLFASLCATILPNGASPAAAQKPIPQDCINACQQLLFDCIAAGEKEHHCISVYRSCTARCK